MNVNGDDRDDLDELRDQMLADPAARTAYEQLRPQYELARAMIALRVSMGLTQKQLAERTGMSQPVIARLESGQVTPRWDTLRRILDALHADLEVTAATPTGKKVSISLFRFGRTSADDAPRIRKRKTA